MMEPARPLNSPSIMAMELPSSPANIRAEPLAQASHQLLNGDCWHAVSKHLSARDVVRLSQVDQYLWQLFPRTRKRLNTLVERYYGSDDESQKRWRSAVEKISWNGHRGQFALWQETHLHNEDVRKWVNSDSLRQRALFRYLSNYSAKNLRLSPRSLSSDSTIASMTPLTGSRLATGSHQGDITIWDLTKKTEQQCVTRLTGHSGNVYRLRALDNGMLVSASNDHTLKIWDLNQPARQECIMTLPVDGGVSKITVLSDHRLAFTSRDNRLIIWDLSHPPRQQPIDSEQMNADILCLDTLSNGQLVCGCGDGTLKILDLSQPAGYEFIALLKGHRGFVRCLVTLPDGTIASGSDDCKVKIWNPNLPPNSCCINTLYHSGIIYSLAMLLDGRLVASVHSHNLVIWDLTRPYPEYTLILHNPEHRTFFPAIHHNGQVITHSSSHFYIWCLDELINSSRNPMAVSPWI